MDKKNILILPDLFPRFPGDLHGIFVIDYLFCVKDRYKILVYYNRLFGQDKGHSFENYEDINIYRNTLFHKRIPKFPKTILYLFWLYKGYHHCIRFKNINLIHTHGIILNGTLGYLVSRKLHIPFIVTVHQGPFSVISAKPFWRFIAKIILENADSVLTVSNHLKEEIMGSGIFPKDIRVTFNPVNTELFNIQNSSTNYWNMIFVGRLDNFKGAMRTVQAFSMIASNVSGWTLTIVGEGEDKTLITEFIIRNPGLKKRINLLGQLTKEEIATELNKSSFLVFPSLHESFGLVIAEAMACGLPVIIGNKTAPQEFVDEECGIKIDPGNISEIAEAMIKMTESYNKYNRINIRNKVVDRFGFESFGNRLHSIYSDIIS